jgi:flagellar export protein FliJ
MGFHFSLDSVLRIRGIVEEQEERMLQKILFEIAQTLEGIERTNSEIAGLDASRSADVFKTFVGYNIHASYEQVVALKERRKELEQKLEKLEQLRDRQLVVYTGARRNREMLTNMCEEKRGVYETDMARREQKTVDDNHMARRDRG